MNRNVWTAGALLLFLTMTPALLGCEGVMSSRSTVEGDLDGDGRVDVGPDGELPSNNSSPDGMDDGPGMMGENNTSVAENNQTSGEPGPLPDVTTPPTPVGPTLTGEPNTLDQGKLFDCKPEETEYARARYWRIDGEQFMRTSRQIKATSRDLINPFSGSQSGRRFNNVADAYSVIESELDMIFIAGRDAARKGLLDNKLPGCLRTPYKDIVQNGTPEPADPLSLYDDGCFRGVASWGLERVLRRKPTEEEVTTYAARFENLIADLGVEQGSVASLTLLLTHPEFLFRREVGAPVAGESFNILTNQEIATAIYLGVANQPPLGSALIEEPEADVETKRALIRAELEMLFMEDLHTSMLMDFLRQYFMYHETSSVFKTGSGQEQSHTGKAVKRGDHFMRRQIEEDTNFLRNLLTSTVIYDIEHKYENATASEDLTRPGILTRESWLFTMSQTEHNDPIKRGHWIRENLMCQKIPAIPIDVIPQLPPKREDQTLRQRLAEHASNPSCAGCHDLMDPLGLPFEQWDDWGRFREMEAGAPVDTSGEIIRFNAVLDGPVADVHELLFELSNSTQVERCFVRHVFRYTMGRDETYGDACTLKRAHDDYVSSNGSIKALIESIYTSDAFLYRTPGEARQ